jgi:hypothetical protein
MHDADACRRPADVCRPAVVSNLSRDRRHPRSKCSSRKRRQTIAFDLAQRARFRVSPIDHRAIQNGACPIRGRVRYEARCTQDLVLSGKWLDADRIWRTLQTNVSIETLDDAGPPSRHLRDTRLCTRVDILANAPEGPTGPTVLSCGGPPGGPSLEFWPSRTDQQRRAEIAPMLLIRFE